jgi:predicted dehydrogenase
MSQDLRVGIVGTSWWADLIHLPSLKSHPRAQLAAICGRDHTRAQELAQKYTIPQVYSDYRAMIEHANLHALVVSTPDDLHYPIVMDALDARVHVLCEKPLALNSDQANAMYEKAEAMGVKHMIFFTWRWMPHFQYLHNLMDIGYVGRCFHCHFDFLGGYGRDGQYGWRFDRQRGNGILGDLGSHMIDFARWFVGDIAKVSAHLTTCVDRVGVNGEQLDPANDAALLAVEFVDGAHGTIQVSAVAHLADRAFEQRVHLYGASGTVEIDVSFSAGADIRGVKSDGEHFDVLPVPDHFYGAVDRASIFPDLFLTQSVGGRLFIDAILDDRPVAPTFYDGLKVQQVIDAAIKSHEQGIWISVG